MEPINIRVPRVRDGWLHAAALGTLLAVLPLADLQGQPTVSGTLLPNRAVRVEWPSAAGGFQLERTDDLGAVTSWTPILAVPVLIGSKFTVDVPAENSRRFFRLRQTAPPVTHIVESSPANGESGVAVTRETVLRFSGPLARNTELSRDHFRAEFGGRRLLTRSELSGDRQTATLFFLEDLPGSAHIRVTLDGDSTLDADGDGVAGGAGVIDFETLSISAVPGTGVIGRVFASERVGTNSVNRPLEGVTITVDGREETLRTRTDARGNFTLAPTPAGRFFVHIDGRTAKGSHWPTNDYYPFIGKAWEAIPGKGDNLASGTGEIFLPLIVPETLQRVSSVAETRIEFPKAVLARNPELEGVRIEVPPNALYSDNGTRGGKVGIAPVAPDRLPEPLPDDLKFALVITVQTDGGQNFAQPVPVRFPNLPDPRTGQKLLPGAKSALWSFDHDLGDWEIVGSMTVTSDGNFVVTDPDVGIRKPGWHGTQPGTRGRKGKIKRRCEPQECNLGPVTMSIGPDGKRTFNVGSGHTPGLVTWSAPSARGQRRQSGESFTALFCQTGNHTVTAKLTPECGDPCEQSVTFNVSQNELPVCHAGFIPAHAPPFKRGEPILLNLQDTDGSPILGDVEWTATAGTPNRGSSIPAQIRFCTPGRHRVDWTVTTPCGTTCSEFQIFEIENTVCGLSPLRVGLGEAKLGESFVLYTTATSPGTLTWDAGGATILNLEAPTELPWQAGPSGYETFSGFQFCTPGRKTIRATLRTPCGEVCAQEFSVDIAAAPCSLDPPRIELGNLRVGESFAIFTKASTSGRITWDAGSGGTVVDPGPEQVPVASAYDAFAIIRYCTPGQKTIRVRLVTPCGESCEQTLTATIQGAICDLDAPQIGLGELKVSRPILIESGSDGVGDIRWDAGDGVVTEPGPLTLPDPTTGRSAFAIVRFCTPGQKTVRVSFTTRCGDICSKSISFQVADSPCELAPFILTAPSGNPRAGEPFAISTVGSEEGTLTWDVVGGQTRAPLEQQLNPPDFRSVMVVTFDAAGVYGVTATLQSRCGRRCFLTVPITVDPPALPSPASGNNDLLLASLREDFVRGHPSGWWGQEPTGRDLESIARLGTTLKASEGSRARLAGNVSEPPLVTQLGLHYFLIQNLDTGRITRGKTGTYGIAHPRGIVLSAKTHYREYILSANGFYIGSSEYTSPQDGGQFDLPEFHLEPAPGLDTDGDGLPDAAEFILGSDSTKADSDGDGVTDAEEAREGTNVGAATEEPLGIIASVILPGNAVDLCTDHTLAVVALEEGGVAVFNILNGLNPALIAIVDTPGIATAVACGDGFAAVADGQEGLAIVALQDPVAARITHHVRLGSPAKSVAVATGMAFVGLESGEVVAVDLLTGNAIARVNILGPVEDLFLAGDFLYALTEGRVSVISLANADFSVIGSVNVPGNIGAGQRRLRLHGGGDRLYTTYTAGFNVLDLTSGVPPKLVRHVQTGQQGWRQLIVNGSGMGFAAVGAFSTDDGLHDVSLYDLRPNGTNAQFVTTFPTPGLASAVAIHNGLGYVADGRNGLEVVRYQAADTKRIPPTVTLKSRFTNGTAEENKQATFTAIVTDDVEVRAVEFYLDEVLVARDGSFPFEYRLTIPKLTAAKRSFRIRARAIDTGGNTADAVTQEIQLIADRTPPVVRLATPRAGTTDNDHPVEIVTLTFSELLDPATLTAARLQLFSAGLDGKLETPDDVPVLTGALSYNPGINTAQWTFSKGLPIGLYRGLVSPGIADSVGNVTTNAFKWSFTVSGPKITGRLPRPGGFVGGQVIRVTFNGPMDPASMTPANFKLINAGSDGNLGNSDDFIVTRGVLSYDPDRFTALMTFDPSLLVNRFRLVLSSNLTDTAGNRLKTNEVWDFRTLQPSLIANTTLKITGNFPSAGLADEFGLALPGGVPLAIANPGFHRMTLRPPEGDSLFSDETTDLLKITVPTNGTYYLLYENGQNFPTSYDLFVGRYATTTNRVDFSVAEEYRFANASARAVGDLLVFELQLPSNTGFFLEWDPFSSVDGHQRSTMFDPAGKVLFTGNPGANQNEIWRTTTGGTYRFVVELAAVTPPIFTIKRAHERTFNVDLSGLTTYIARTNLNVPGSVDTYNLTLPAGTPFAFVARRTFACLDWDLTDLAGRPLFTDQPASMCGAIEFPDVARGGRYQLRVAGTLQGLGTYEFKIVKPAATITPHDLTATNRFTDSGVLDIPGASRVYELRLAAGESWRFRDPGEGEAATGALWTLNAPDGQILFGPERIGAKVHNLITDLDGTYRLTVSHGGDLQDAGSYEVSLQRFISPAGNWLALQQANGPTNQTFAISLFDSKIVVAGPFGDGSSIARLEGDTWIGFGRAEKTNGNPAAVFTLLAQGGNLYAGGDFERIGGITANGVARWDGIKWHPLGDGLTVSPPAFQVRALVFHGNDLFVGGRFQRSGTLNVTNLARWNGSAWSAVGWHTFLGLPDQFGIGGRPDTSEVVHALAVFGDLLIVGGDFQFPGNDIVGIGFDGLLNNTRFGVDGFAGAGRFDPADVRALSTTAARLIAGGSYHRIWTRLLQPRAVENLATWDGTTWTDFAGGLDGPVNTTAWEGDVLYAGGEYSYAGLRGTTDGRGTLANGISRWDGLRWTTLGFGVEREAVANEPRAPGRVNGILANPDQVIVVGDFHFTGNIPASFIGIWRKKP